MDAGFLLKAYGAQYDSEAGPWNLSVENKYLEYMFAKFFEENFEIKPEMKVCNIGIGAGYWDRYLSYQIPEGELTSIDIDEECCRQLRECLLNEKNPNRINIIHSDVMCVEGKEEDVFSVCAGKMKVENYLLDENYGFRAQYWKLTKL